jgi:uncharacterized protein YjiS (DUF1127 family)
MVCSCARQVGDRGDLYELDGSARRAGRRGKYPSSANGLWEHLMLNPSGSLTGATRRNGVRSRELRITLRDWLAKPWRAIASRWAHRRRHREIKKAVAALTKLDDGTLRGIGIPHRSQIEQVVRYCRDC